MKTTNNSPEPESAHPANLDGSQGRLIFFGPKETIRKLKGRPFAPLGKPVSRQEIKELANEYVNRVTNPTAMLDTRKEPMTLLIEKEDIDILFSDPKCTRLVALLAVETNPDHNKPHQTFVLLPCDDEGKVVRSEGANATDDEGRERWPIIRNVESIRRYHTASDDVEAFLREEFDI